MRWFYGEFRMFGLLQKKVTEVRPVSRTLYKLEQKLSTKFFEKAADAATLLFFFGFILAPIFALFATVFLNWETVLNFVFADRILGNRAWQLAVTALKHSFQIALIAS